MKKMRTLAACVAVSLLSLSCAAGQPKDEFTAVDMGLSVLWAAENVGATEVDMDGERYSWTELQHMTWKDGWRLPTMEEMHELVNCGHRDWSMCFRPEGSPKRNLCMADYLVRFNSWENDSTLQFPAYGAELDGDIIGGSDYTNEYIVGFYWTSTPSPNDEEQALMLIFDFDEQRGQITVANKEVKASVRLVRDKN